MVMSISVVPAQPLTLITEDYPPLNFVTNGQLKGPSVEIVERIRAKLGLKQEIQEIKVYPWARGYRFLQTKANTELFSTARTKQREALFKWVGPVAQNKSV